MKRKYLKISISFLLVFFVVGVHSSIAYAKSSNDILLGITWGTSKLVSFDPALGTILQELTALNTNESFTGLTYDRNHNKLYALSQVQNNLYSIDTITLKVSLIGKLNSNETSWIDANALAYDPVSNTLYTVTINWDWPNNTIFKGELAKINLDNAELTIIGEVSEAIEALSFNEKDKQLYALAVKSQNDQDKAHIIRINPENAQTNNLFDTPYHAILGLAKKPYENIYYCWINETSHIYSAINLDTKTITPLGNSDSVNAISAIVYKDFTIGLTRFSTFKVNTLMIRQRHGNLFMLSNFALGKGSNGINPMKEAVTLKIGNVTMTIPAGSFHKTHIGVFTFVGQIDNMWIEALIKPFGHKRFGFRTAVYDADFGKIKNPVPVELTIGNDSDITTVNAIIKK